MRFQSPHVVVVVDGGSVVAGHNENSRGAQGNGLFLTQECENAADSASIDSMLLLWTTSYSDSEVNIQ